MPKASKKSSSISGARVEQERSSTAVGQEVHEDAQGHVARTGCRGESSPRFRIQSSPRCAYLLGGKFHVAFLFILRFDI